jgi:hypothetical protein
MNSKISDILIAGAGQLGSRYLQGLVKCRVPLRIYVQDIFKESLYRAERRWIEVLTPEVPHEVIFCTSFAKLPRKIDVAIVTTTADVRPDVTGEIARRIDVRFWVLEKVLAQSESGLDQIISHIKKDSYAWVNLPRRINPWHKKIKSQFNLKPPLDFKFEGKLWGLACNAVHLLDLIEWWTDETLQSVCTDRLDQSWFESTRPTFWEVLGGVEARFSGGSCAFLVANQDGVSGDFGIRDDQLSWMIKEAEGLARRSDGVEIPGRLKYQSELTADMVESILETGTCELPTLNESAALHRIFILSMLKHWRRSCNPDADFIPIT